MPDEGNFKQSGLPQGVRSEAADEVRAFAAQVIHEGADGNLELCGRGGGAAARGAARVAWNKRVCVKRGPT